MSWFIEEFEVVWVNPEADYLEIMMVKGFEIIEWALLFLQDFHILCCSYKMRFISG